MKDQAADTQGRDSSAPGTDRRGFLSAASGVAMAGGLLAGYGTFFAYAGRFLYPPSDAPTAWMYVTDVGRLEPGESMLYRTPAGEPVVIARQSGGDLAADFLALSSTCPHLGCQVHWEGAKNRFFCPCHNGTFDAAGLGTGGPPEGQSLLRYPLRVEAGLLYLEVPLTRLAAAPHEREGHDGCLGGGPTA